MSKRTVAFFLLSLLFIIPSMLISCDEPTVETPPEEEPENTDPPSDSFNLYHNGEILSVIIIPEDASTTEERVATRILTRVLQLSGQKMVIKSDAELDEAPNGAVIVGKTKLSESTDAYSALGAREAIASIKSGKLVIAFNKFTSANSVTDDLISAITGNRNTTVSIPLDFSARYEALPTAEELPLPEGAESYANGDSSTMLYLDSTPEKFQEYCASVGAAGFLAVSDREEAGNLFATFKGEDVYVYAYYVAYSGKLRVLTGPVSSLADEDYSTDAKTTYTPYLTSIEQPDNGLGLIMRLPDGRFIIYDGGYSGEDRVYAALRELVPSGEIVIAAWIITHPHNDHYGAFTDSIKIHRSDKSIIIERVMLNVTEKSRYSINTEERVEDVTADVDKIYSTLRTYRPDLPLIKLHTGQMIDFGGATLEVLYTVEDIMPEGLPNANDSSMVVRLTLGGSSIMLLGDTCYRSGPIMNDTWGEYLKSDFVQVAHHGLWPSVESIYHSIAAEVVLVPAVLFRYKYDILDTRWDEQTEAILSYAKDLYTTCDEPIMIEFPYVFKNNKDAAVELIKNYVPKDGEPTE